MGAIDAILNWSFSSSRLEAGQKTREAQESIGFLAFVGCWMDQKKTKWRTRRVLRRLSDEQIRDIGVTRKEANREAARWFWD